MSPVDIITLAVFFGILLAGLGAGILADAMRQRPKHRIRERIRKALKNQRSSLRADIAVDLSRAQTEARRRRRRAAMGRIGYYMNRLDTIAGHDGVRHLALAMAALSALGLVGLIVGLIPAHWWTVPAALFVAPLLLGVVAYHWLLDRFRHRFLSQLPDALDMIVRASQAGIPVTQSMRSVGQQFTAPLGPEFRRMGDSLLLGNSLEDVLDDGALRIELADFSFFSVCVLLQRESGGSVVEALENLSAIIRARRDLGLKARALTAEGRLSGVILSLLPFLILLMLYFTNRPYVEVLFITETGQMLLGVAGLMLIVGILAIRRLSRLEI